MGIYWAAFDHREKVYFQAPGSYSNTLPTLYHPENPFPNMLAMALLRGHCFVLEMDNDYLEYVHNYLDITESVFNGFIQQFPEFRDKYDLIKASSH